jgi:hypothetical protein
MTPEKRLSHFPTPHGIPWKDREWVGAECHGSIGESPGKVVIVLVDQRHVTRGPALITRAIHYEIALANEVIEGASRPIARADVAAQTPLRMHHAATYRVRVRIRT